MKADVYFSVDVEADGPIPGPFSMSSIGVCAAATYDGTTFTRVPADEYTFYRELRPISDEFDPAAAAVAGLDRDHLIAHGAPAEQAMRELDDWLRTTADRVAERYAVPAATPAKGSASGRAVFVGYPLGFDWLWTYWYLMRFAGRSPFGHSAHLDMKTMFARAARVPISRSTKRSMPAHLHSRRKHQHHGLADAKEQAELFCNLWEWAGPTEP